MTGLKSSRIPCVPLHAARTAFTCLTALLAVLGTPTLAAFQQAPELTPYVWKPVRVGPFGFVTGMVIHPKDPEVRYIRTDVGGAYRWDRDKWTPITDNLVPGRVSAPGIESLALDPSDPNKVYLAAAGGVFRSDDRGKTWQRMGLHTRTSANSPFRCVGERLAVDPADGETLLFGSRYDGLYRCTKGAWSQISAQRLPTGLTDDMTGAGISFVLFDPRGGEANGHSRLIYAGVMGVSVFSSTDGGEQWNRLDGGPSTDGAGHYCPMRAALDTAGTLYVTFSKVDPGNPNPDSPVDGQVWKYTGGRTDKGAWTNITPARDQPMGFNALAVDDDRIYVAQWEAWTPCRLFVSRNGGAAWDDITPAPESVNFPSGPYIHRLIADGPSALILEPGNGGAIWMTDGMGVYRSDNPNARAPRWTSASEGVEELVVQPLVKVPHGSLLSGVADVVGFRHNSLDDPPSQKFEPDLLGWTTGMDFCEANPDYVVRTGRQLWPDGISFASVSTDGGASWTRFPEKGRPKDAISGEVAVSASAANGVPTTILWAPEGKAVPYYSDDGGESWSLCAGAPHTELCADDYFTPQTIASDRKNGQKFYIYDQAGGFYRSEDGAKTFTQVSQGALPSWREFTLKAQPNTEGALWMIFHNVQAGQTQDGVYRSSDGGSHWTKMAQIADVITLGFGKAAPERANPTLFVYGVINGVTGLFRSDDVTGMTGRQFDGAEAKWVRCNDAQQSLPLPNYNSLDGDRDIYGRVYLGTSGRGILYGDAAN